MTVGKAVFNLLLADTDLRAIVDNRIFPEVAQQDAVLPYVVYNISSNEPSDTKREPSKMDTAQVEVNLYSTSYTECIDMSTHVRAALDRVTGTYSGVNVQSIQYLGEVIDFDEAQRAYNITSDYDVRVSRSNFEIAQGSPITGVTLGELSDVDTTGVTDGQLIAYDAAAQEWQPADDAGGVTQLGQLTDVQFGQGGPESGDLLKYDGSEWTNDSLTKSEIGLGNVDNTSDASKPVSTATQTELNAKANSADLNNVDNTSDANKPVSTATQTALNAKADTSAVPTDLNDLSDVSIVGSPAGNQALIYDVTAGAFKSQVSYTNRFEDEVETGINVIGNGIERAYSVKAEGDGIYLDASPDTPTAGKVIKRKIYHKTGFISDSDAIGDYTLIHTFADDTTYANTVAVFDAFEDGATYGVPPFTLFQTWEEVTAAPAFTGLLNETYGSGAEAAYSTRRLNGNVTECMVIRRASDSTTTTIGFDASGNIDEAAITTFCTGTSCTVYQWLDQSGNGNTATAAAPANEPTIYTGGALVKENGKLALDFDGTSDSLTSSTPPFSGTTNRTSFTVSKANTATSSDIIYGINSIAGATGTAWQLTAETQLRVSGRIAFNNSAQTIYSLGTLVFDGTTVNDANFYLNGSITTQGTSTGATINTDNTDWSIGNTPTQTTFYDGKQQELIFYANAKSGTDQASIEENIGDYFTQNTPLLDTYSGAAAAYSLRRLSSSYVGSAVEVYNGSSYANVGFNVFGELDTVALAAHCGSNDGFVSKWYDQSGNSFDFSNGTAAERPKIYDGLTGVVTEGNKPALLFSSSGLKNTDSINASVSDYTFMAVLNRSSIVNDWFFDTQTGRLAISGSSGAYYDGGWKGTALSTGYKFVELYLNSTGSNIYENASLTQSGVSYTQTAITSANSIGMYYGGGQRYIQGTMQEMIIYPSDQDAANNRAGIETNINTFYNIYS